MQGYRYKLQLSNTTNMPPDSVLVIAEVGAPIDYQSAVLVTVQVPQQTWLLYVQPNGDWKPPWRAPVIAAVVVISSSIASLLFIAGRLVATTLETNKRLAETTGKLEEEKERMDALVVRQFRLIECLGGKDGDGTGGAAAAAGGGGGGGGMTTRLGSRGDTKLNSMVQLSQMPSVLTEDGGRPQDTMGRHHTKMCYHG